MDTGDVLLIGGGVLVYSLLRKKQGLQSLNFYPDKVHSFTFEGLTPVFIIGFGVQNVSNQSFTVKALAGSLYTTDAANNTILVGNISDFNQEVIPAQSQGTLTVQARLMLIGIVNELIDAFQNNNFRMNLKIKANANVDNLIIPINQQISVGL